MKGLFVDDGGRGGVPVVFHHGLGADLEVWRGQLEHLRKSRRAVAYDARGHGRSPKAAHYSAEALADDLDEVVAQLGIARFWLVGHSYAGLVLSRYAGKHPEKLAGLIYVDAVGDVSSAPAEMIQFYLERDRGMTPARLQEEYLEMIGPLARPETRQQVLAAAARMDLPALATLRAQMPSVRAAASVAKFSGPKLAIDAEGNDSPFAAYNLPGVRRKLIAGVSHWLMLDDPDALNAALDQALR